MVKQLPDHIDAFIQTYNIKTGSRAALFTSANIGSINLNAQESTWYGKVDYVAAYKKLWGVS